MRKPRVGEVGEVRVERSQVLRRRVAAVLKDSLVPGSAGVAGFVTGELPDDPVSGFYPARGGCVDRGILFQQLQCLGELPLGGDLAAVAPDPRFLALVGEVIDPVGV